MSSIPAEPDAALREALRRYAERWPEERDAALFLELLDDPADPFRRERLAGHFTASCWLVDRAGARVLLTHHRKLGRWLQLGGHADGDRDLARVALREAEEESGLGGLTVEPGLFDLDRHWIPARGDVPGHWHYDARFVVRAGTDERYVVSEESHDLAWREIAGIAGDPQADESLRRMARKWLAAGNG
ncbi:NUDIX hydrolase [Vulcaniibacterium tengchongense]|uniref:NUDIX domain-containing protein n=1 Tax=Vulcaniibacterium tengchongense TaxID=1273429 RepID=A0A3N4VKP8_9GAMM|nr:NUDIX hydrolase [Vulcaniibacterium tengchongense]RPE81995.1 NUDIX domain-containing protein [Vulcaniibacterium tengchongense]